MERKLLWERVPSEQIVTVMRGPTDADYKRLLFGDVKLIARGEVPAWVDHGRSQMWRRAELAPGVELQLRADMGALGDEEVERVLARVREILRG